MRRTVRGLKRPALTVSLIAACCVAWIGPAFAGVREAHWFLRADNPLMAEREVRALAEAGDAEAQYLMGLIYRDPKHPGCDYAEALRWTKKSADQGNPEAWHSLGVQYSAGEMVPRDDRRAFEYLSKAVERGVRGSHLELGKMYIEGRGVEKDAVKGVALLKRELESGNLLVGLRLARLYLDGIGVEKDPAAAAKLLLPWSAVPMVQLDLGKMYARGIGLEQDASKGFAMVLAIASPPFDNPEAMREVASLHRDGVGTARNEQAASEWEKKAAAEEAARAAIPKPTHRGYCELKVVPE